MKIIKVTSCADCVLRKRKDYSCWTGKRIVNIESHVIHDTIHEDCPLEDGCDEKEVE
jgi:hypothetical protein